MTRAYANSIGISERSHCFVLRRLATNPALRGEVAHALAAKLNSGAILPMSVLRFDASLIEAALKKTDVALIARLAADIGRGGPLPLWIDKKCYFEPLNTGIARILFLYLLLPPEKRAVFMDEMKSKWPLLHGECVKTLAANPLFKTCGSDEEKKMVLIKLMAQWDLIGPNAFTRRARYYRMEHPPRKYIIR